MRYQELIEAVEQRGDLAGPDTGERVTESVLIVLAEQLDSEQRERLANLLPAKVADPIRRLTEPANRTMDVSEFVRRSSAREDAPSEQAHHHAHAVLSTLADSLDDEEARALFGSLPQEYAELFGARFPAFGARKVDDNLIEEPIFQPPGVSPRWLDDEQAAEAAAKLEGWTGDKHRLVRTVGLPPGYAETVLDQVGKAADAFQHKPQVRRNGNEVTFEVSTSSIGMVTEDDVKLAAEIDRIVANLGRPR